MRDLNERLQAVQEQRAGRDRLNALLGRAEGQLGEQTAKMRGLRDRLEKERKDVARLEGLSLTALFHTVLSSKTEQLQKERQELLQATLHHDECAGAINALEGEVARLRGELKGLEAVDAEYERLVVAKEEALLGEDGDLSRRLFALGDELAAARSQARELREAAVVGGFAFDSLQEVIDSLGTARNWGTWDMVGGGLIATAMKHSHIDKSREFAREAQDDLRRFESELGDVALSGDLELEVGSFNTFADYFLDGLIFDWVVQSKINQSREAAAAVQRQVYGILRTLDAEIAVAERRTEEVEAERRSLIEHG